MDHWLSYSLEDFLLFSPSTYYRLFESLNVSAWPLHLVTLAFGVLLVAMLRRQVWWRGYAIATGLAACWLWVAWAYHLERYAGINWAAPWLAGAFAAQALLLIWLGVIHNRFSPGAVEGSARYAAPAFLLFALVLQPLAGLLAGRSWAGAEIFGIAPDPTVTATLGLVLLASGAARWILLVIPVLWCVVSGATLQAMGSPEAWMMPLLGLAAIVAAVADPRRR
ncbi:DUF6064 family protein [Iodidimonas sp. SYSU 1G8]|uniref:DUF6064 family protein n=1 Tax=Iodidimonas sp. SYSU 1G8 TaxID=3133967 RepID=UPI0031FF0DDC